MGCRSGCGAAVVSLLLAALVALGSASVARADGDPASDYLVSNEVFLTSQSVAVSPAERQLVALVRSANRAGFPIRVALISSDYDLGSITALWQKPRVYARFLGLELAGVYKQRLLVVMPNGFGFNWLGHSVDFAYRQLAGVPIAPRRDGLSAAAAAGIRRLAAAAGVALTVAPPAGSAPPRSGGTDLLPILAAALAALVAIAALVASTRARTRRREPVSGLTRSEPTTPAPAQPSAHRGPALPIRLKWLIPGVALLCAVAVATPIIVLGRGAVSVTDASVVTPPPFSWPAGRRPAPNFALHDQNGRPVSITAYRGRPVIVTFIDPLCRNLCPLEAQVLNQTVSEMPVSRRPAIVAVSVDVWADTRADMLQDYSEWHLVPQWRWAVGTPAQLAAVWGRYGVGVKVITRRIAGTTINYITHTEAAYILDATGHERALFFWPFYPQDVKRVLSQLE